MKGECTMDKEKLEQILVEANKAKDDLYRVIEKLEEAGYNRKAMSGMSLIYAIETWQNRG